MKKIIPYLFITSLIFALASCGDGTTKKGFGDLVREGSQTEDLTFDEVENVETLQILQNISSSPIEMAALLLATNVPFNENFITSIDGINRYNTDFKRAVNLGIFGADLGYMNMYKKTGPVVTNMKAISKLSEELRVQQFFDFKTIRRLATNNENLDSLMYLSVSSFNNMDSYLQKSGRSEISALIICGTWLEGMYIATQVVKSAKKNEEVVERIGEQKQIVDNLVDMLATYSNRDSHFEKIYQQFVKIQNSFDGITKSIIQGKPEQIEMDGIVVYIQNETSMVDVPPTTLKNIISVIEEVRSEVINM